MKILVTGCLGTIGRPLCRALVAEGHQVVGVDLFHAPLPLDQYRRADIADHRQLMQAWSTFEQDGRPIELVYNLAAEFGRINGVEHYEQVWRSNCIGLRSLMNVIERRGRDHGGHPAKLVHASTSEVYGDPRLDQLDGRRFAAIDGGTHVILDEWLADACPRPRNDYAISKYANELQLHTFGGAAWGHPWAGVRIFNCYGPGEVGNARRSVVARFVLSLLRGEQVTVYQRTYRDALYIDDLIPALLRFIDGDRFEGARGQFVNLSGGEYVSIAALFDVVADVVSEETGRPIEDLRAFAIRMDFESGNSPHKEPGRGLAGRLLDWKPTTRLRDGIRQTVAWTQAELREGRLTSGW